MIVNPYKENLEVFVGTRLLKKTFHVIGRTVVDPVDRIRGWTVHGLYAPIPKRALGGIRARLMDSQGVATFINQRDLEVLLGMGVPGRTCTWLEEPYLGPGDPNWFGFCTDYDDLMDDLMEHELLIRGTNRGALPIGVEVRREVHTDKNTDMEEVLMSVSDMNFETGTIPDPNIASIHSRWTRTHSKRLI